MPKVLVVDDDYAILESTKILLECYGYEVSTSEDGSFIERKINSEKPDVIIMDYWLPKESGAEITRKLKSRDDTKDIPVIFVSASYNIHEIVRTTGADDFIPKPYNMEQLLKKINKHLNTSN